MKRALSSLAVASVAALVLAGCGGGGGGPLGGPSSAAPPAPSDTIRVGSANFTESTLIAEIYAAALRTKGLKVERASLGSRETYFPALRDGSIDLIPDYTGTLLQYLDKNATQTASNEVYDALKKVVPAPLTVLDKAPGEDKDAVVVTKQTAQRYNATSIADLAPHCGELVFGGPPEFQQRPDGIPGIQKNYTCSFKSYRSLDVGGPLTLKALTDDTVQAADLFTTDPNIEQKGLVALADPKNNFAAQNVVPVINQAKATDQVKQTLNAVNAKLTTQTLVELNGRLNAPEKPDPATVAKTWLGQNGLG